MLTASHADRPTFNTRRHTQNTSPSTTSAPHPDISPTISQETTPTPKPLTMDRLEALIQMQRTDPFCKCISKWLLNSKAPQHEFDTFTHLKGLFNSTSQTLVNNSLPWLSQNLGSTQSWWKSMTNWVTKVIPHVLFNKKAILLGREWIKTLENILPTVYFANEKRPRFNNALCRWRKYQIDHSIK